MLETPKQTVLVVDDSPFEREYLARLLDAKDRHVLTAESGEKALDILKGVETALVLLDVHMHGLSGLETAALIRKSRHNPFVPIIFITAMDTKEEHIVAGYSAGAVDYLEKPVDPELLRSKVRVFCQLSAQKATIQRQLDEIRRMNVELTRQIDEIRQLRGMIPICVHCKSVRDDEGFWQTIEYYLGEHSGAEFSHSLCPGCRDELYPGLPSSKKRAAEAASKHEAEQG